MTTKETVKICLLSCLAGLPLHASALTLDPNLTLLLTEQMSIESYQVTPTAKLTDDLGADSLDLVELMMAVEEQYEIEIPDAVCENIQTVADLQTVINGGLSPSGYCPNA